MGSHSLLQGIFLTQGLNPCLLNCRQILHHLSHQGSLELFKGSCLLSFPVFIITTYSIQKVGRHDTKTLTSIPPPKITTASGEGDGTPLQYSCLENPMERGAWWAAVHGVAKSRTRLSDFIFTFHFHALEKEMATHSSVLAWRTPGTGEPGGLPSMGSHRVGHD